MILGKAFTRAVSPRLAECALTHLQRRPIDPVRAAGQHAAYEAALAAAGLTIERLTPLPDHPDGVFVEDTALILGEHAVITRPGAKSRADETISTAAGLAHHFTVHHLAEGRIDGGDVLRIGRTLYVGRSGRTDPAGIAALAGVVRPLGYRVEAVPIDAALHLKTAVTFAGDDRDGTPVLLYDAAAIRPDPFVGVDPVAVDPSEPAAANVLRVGLTLIVAKGNDRTGDMLTARGFDLVVLDVSELQKAESGLTCMSLVAAGSE